MNQGNFDLFFGRLRERLISLVELVLCTTFLNNMAKIHGSVNTLHSCIEKGQLMR